MIQKTKILQLGFENWESDLSDKNHSELEWTFFSLKNFGKISQELIKDREVQNFDVILCTDALDNKLLRKFSRLVEAYSIIIDINFKKDLTDEIKLLKYPFFMNLSDKNHVLKELSLYFFSGQRGDKQLPDNIVVSDYFQGEWNFSGQYCATFQGNFSETLAPLFTWKKNIFMNERSQKIWLEYSRDETVEIEMTIFGYYLNQEQSIKIWNYTEAEIKQGIEIEYDEGLSELNVTMRAFGNGSIHIGALHHRESRNKYGEFFLGGEKVFDENNEEVFYYFNPGNLKPPLNVYFSDYHSSEGFEGFYMMKSLGSPFLLISDPRLEGGAFYLGSSELERKIIEVITDNLKKLDFSQNELILSGISMGAFGALYYGSKLSPHTIIVGKPIANLGNVAENERIIRPGSFVSALDILKYLTGTLSPKGIEQLNKRFWNTFDLGNFDSTQFIVSYMENDDYDGRAYEDLLEHLSSKDARMIAKGIRGRHNDNFKEVFNWFFLHYKRVLIESFERGGENNDI